MSLYICDHTPMSVRVDARR